MQLGELALTGATRAEDALYSLGLVAEDLQKQTPEAAFRAVLFELQKIPNVANRAIAAEEIFGGTSEKLAGVINLTTAEFAALEKEVIATSDIWSGEALASAKAFDLEMQHLKTELGKGSNVLVVQMLPALTTTARYIRTDVLPAWKDFKELALSPVRSFIKDELIPTLGNLYLRIRDELEPVIALTGETIRTILLPKVKGIQIIIDHVILPALEALWNYFGKQIIGVFEEVKEAIGPLVEAFSGLATIVQDFTGKALTGIKTVWTDKVKPALSGLEFDLTKTVRPAVANVDLAFLDMATTFSTGSKEMRGDATSLGRKVTAAFKGVSDFIERELIPIFKEIYEFVWPLIVETWEEHLLPTFEAIVAFIRDNIIPWIKENKVEFITAWNIIKTVVVGIVKSLFLQIETGIGLFTATIRTLLALIQGDWNGVWQGISDFFEEIWEYIVGTFDAFGVDLVKIMKGIANGMIGSIEAIPNAFIAAINTIIRAWNGFSLHLPGFQVNLPFGKSFGFDGVTLNTPNIPTIPRVSIPRLGVWRHCDTAHAGATRRERA